MNINCQNSAYVSRLNLSKDDEIHKLLQGEIDVLTANLDITNSNLQELKLDYEYTSNDIYDNITPITWLINNETTPATIIPPSPAITNTYIYNSNLLGEIRFWNINTSNFPPVIPFGVPDYRVKIDVDGKLKIYYTYDPLINLTWGNGWIDPGNMIIGLVADSANQGATIAGLQTEIIVIDTKFEALFGALEELVQSGQILTNLDEDQLTQWAIDVGNITGSTDPQVASQSVRGLFNDVSSFLTTGRTTFLNRATNAIGQFINKNPLTSFIIGAGGTAVGISYGILQNIDFNKTLSIYTSNIIQENSNLTSNQRRDLYENEVMDMYYTCNIISNLQNNFYLNQAQGFINSNIITPQTIPMLNTSRIGIGISISSNFELSNFELDVVGKINSDYYYRSGVRLFTGTSNDYSNLSLSQGFINSNVLTAQTIPIISGSRIGLGITPSTSYELEVIGTTKTDTLIINNLNFNDIINNTSNAINNDLNVLDTTTSNLRDTLTLLDDVFTTTLNNNYCKKSTFLIETNYLINYDSINYYTYTIDLTKYVRYLQISDITKLLRFRINATLASSVAVFSYLTECEYKIMMSQSSSIGQTGGFHCRAFGIPEDLNLTKFDNYKFVKTDNIYQLVYLSPVQNAKFLITIIDEL